MKKNEHVEYWVNSANGDLTAADTLFKSAKYDWCLFIGHLVYAPRNMLTNISKKSRSIMDG